MTRTRFGSFGQRLADRRAEAADVRHLLGVVDREAAADVERVERAELLAPRLRQQPGAGLDGLDMLERHPAPASRRGTTSPRTWIAELARQPRQLECRSSGSQPNLRDRSHDRAGAAERHAQQQLGLVAVAPELAHLIRVVGDEDLARPRCSALRMSMSRLIGCVWMQRAGSMPEPRDQLHFAGGGEIQPAAQLDDGPHHGRMRQRLERVVQVDAGQRLAAACGTARARAGNR